MGDFLVYLRCWLSKYCCFRFLLGPLYRLLLKSSVESYVRSNFQKNANTVLQAANSALKDAGVDFWLEYGTLLGVIRDGDFIKHDTES